MRDYKFYLGSDICRCWRCPRPSHKRSKSSSRICRFLQEKGASRRHAPRRAKEDAGDRVDRVLDPSSPEAALGSMAFSSSPYSESLSAAGSSGEGDACGRPSCGFRPYRLVQSADRTQGRVRRGHRLPQFDRFFPPRPDGSRTVKPAAES
jgi:hypothetical protein